MMGYQEILIILVSTSYGYMLLTKLPLTYITKTLRANIFLLFVPIQAVANLL